MLRHSAAGCSHETIMEVINYFRTEFLLNVIVYDLENFFYQIPFDHLEPKLIKKNYLTATTLQDIFPDKVKDLNGHVLRLVQMHSPPASSVFRGKNGTMRFEGIQKYLLDIILKKLNATYELQVANHTKDIYKSYRTHRADFTLNLLSPFWSQMIGNCDFLGTNEVDTFRILVRTMRKNNILQNRFFTRDVLIYISAILLSSCFYTIFLDRKFRDLIRNLFFFYQLLLQQPAQIRMRNLSSKIFILSVILLCFVKSVYVTTSITSTIVNYLPSTPIDNIEDIVQSNITVYANGYSVSVLKSIDFDLPQEFVDRLTVVNYFPWKANTSEDFAFVANSMTYNRFIKSATYNDPHDQQRFSLLPGYISKFPVYFVFPKNSPFAEIMQRTYIMTVEAGLQHWWAVIQYNHLKDWTNFKPSNYGNLKAEEFLNLNFVFQYYFYGVSLSIVVFIIEIIVGKWRILFVRRRVVQRRESGPVFRWTD